MIFHREDSIKALKEAEKAARITEQTIKAAKLMAASATTFSDAQALELPALFPTWEEVLSAGAELAANTFITKDCIVYRVVQAVTPQAHQAPDSAGMLAIYRPAETSHSGTQDDPIPWVYGMDCHTGQYFSYNGHVYRCAGDMIPCVWEPGSAGLWQWELVS